MFPIAIARRLTRDAPMLARLNFARQLSSLPISIKPSAQEVALNRLSWHNLQLATRALHRDGLVVVEDLIDPKELDFLNERMVRDAHILQAAGDNSPYNYNKGNIQQDPPLVPSHFNPSIFLNPLVTQITSSVLGPRPRLSFISGNTALPPSADSPPQSQPVHADADFEHPDCPFALVINVPLVSMGPENGSTEVWLGSHHGTGINAQEGQHGERASGRIQPRLLEERRKMRPPTQPVIDKGSVAIRDLRLWHAGKPNMTPNARVMLAMIHFAPWYRNQMQVDFAEELEPHLEAVGSELHVQSRLLPEQDIEASYLNRPYGNAYDFNQVDRLEGVF